MGYSRRNTASLSTLLLVLLAACIVGGCDTNPLRRWETGAAPPSHSQRLKPWTLMMYVAADVEQEVAEYLLRDLRAVLEYGSTANVHVVVQVDFPGTKLEAARYYVAREKLHRVGSIKDFDPANPDMLADFMNWGISWPAEHYALFILGHGTGWITMDPDNPVPVRGSSDATQSGPPQGSEDSAGGRSFGYAHSKKSSITLNNFSEVLNRVLGDQRLDIAVFNSCLMNGIETAFTISRHFDYLVAAETVMPAFGLDYAFILDRMGREALSPAEAALHIHAAAESEFLAIVKPDSLAQRAADKDFDVARRRLADSMSYSVTCLDLSYIPAVTLAIRDFTDAWHNHFKQDWLNAMETISMSIRNSRRYGELFAQVYQQFAVPPEFQAEYAELRDLMYEVYDRTTDQKLRTAARRVIESLDDCVMATWSCNPNSPPAAMSVFMPASRDFYHRFLRNPYLQLEWPIASHWGAFLDTIYYNY